MNIIFDETKLVADAIATALPAAKLELMAETLLQKRITLLGMTEVSRLLDIGINQARALPLPFVKLGDRKMRFRLTDIEAYIAANTEVLR